MREAAQILDELGVPYHTRIVSAHRTPDRLWDYGKSAVGRGLRVIIAGAGARPICRHDGVQDPRPGDRGADPDQGAVRCRFAVFDRADAQGYPVATMAIGAAGAANAGLMAAGILALNDPALAQRLDDWRMALSASIPEEPP